MMSHRLFINTQLSTQFSDFAHSILTQGDLSSSKVGFRYSPIRFKLRATRASRRSDLRHYLSIIHF